ncbi:hypothetical protein Bca4012_060544 [Brassica carinata]|uniref:NB-ARC domain-containing protein n=1 Tax=Brassica carinata TaxID=52824 RepID=A0A8X7S9L2_BRACI|nr:hypothetical protein Bca52824_030878 [Brassica carinata]
MAQDTSQEVDRHDFEKRFQEKYKKWKASSGAAVEVDKEEDRLETKHTPPKHEIYGFDNEIKSLEKFLLDQKVYREFKSLVIVGEYGVGKTALCQKIFNKEQVKSVYAPRIWVSMHSKEAKEGEDKKISVLKRLLKGLGVEEEMFESINEEVQKEMKLDGETEKEKELSAFIYALHLNLRKEDKWDEKLDEKLKKDVKWGKHLSDGFPKGSGGRVIYTTRDKTVAEKLVRERHEIHRLWPLSSIYDEAVVIEKKREPPSVEIGPLNEWNNVS